MIKCLIWLFKRRQIDMMSAKFPISEDRKRLLQSSYDLPPKDREMLYKAVAHLRWPTMLWDLEELSPDSMPRAKS